MPAFSWMLVTVAALYPPILFLGAALWWTPRTCPGAVRWTAANCLIFLGLLGMVLGEATTTWVYAAANVLFFAAIILSLEGNREFRGLQPRVGGVYAGGGVAIVADAWFANQPDTRAAVASGFFGMISALCAATLLKNIPSGHKFGSRFTGGMFALSATLYLARAIYLQFTPAGLAGRVAEISAMVCLVLIACCSIGWLVLAGERRLMDLEEAETWARSMAERAAEANRIKSEYARMLGHEIRNPLSGIIATTDLLLDAQLAMEERDAVLMLRSAAEALVRMTDDVLDLSKLEAGSLTIASAEFDLPALAADVTRIFGPVAKSRGIELAVEFANGMPLRFIGDSGRIRQIVVNLVANALRFTSQGRIVIRACCESQDAVRARVRVAVTDTGSGIPPERIAEILRQTSEVRSEGGHGIGLVISRKLIEQMGGAMEVRSQVGQGSTFEFVLPLRIAQKCEAHVEGL